MNQKFGVILILTMAALLTERGQPTDLIRIMLTNTCTHTHAYTQADEITLKSFISLMEKASLKKLYQLDKLEVVTWKQFLWSHHP